MIEWSALERTLKIISFPPSCYGRGTSPTRPGCSELCPTWHWTLPGIHNFTEQHEWRKILSESSFILSLSPYFFWRAQYIALPEWPIMVPHALSACFNLMKKVSPWAAPSITSSWKLYILYILHEKRGINNSLVHLLKYLFSNSFYHLFFLDIAVSDKNICPKLSTFANNTEIYIIIKYCFLWWRVLKLKAAHTFSAAISVHTLYTN